MEQDKIVFTIEGGDYPVLLKEVLEEKKKTERKKGTCYLIAKRYNEHGCLSLQAEYGKELASLVDYLGRKKANTDVQILTVSSKEDFGEYAPYNDVKTEAEFILKVLEM